MRNLIFDIEQRSDTLCEDLVRLSARSSNGTELPPLHAGAADITRFPSGEFCVSYMESVRGCRVFLLSSTTDSDSIARLEHAIDAAKRNSASEIIAIVPYFAYARQDRRDARPGHQRSSIGASMQAIKYEALGLDRIIIADVHSEQTQGMFRIPVDHAECSEIIAKQVMELFGGGGGKVTLISPDAGGVKRVTKVIDYLLKIKSPDLDVQIGFCSKKRDENNKVSEMTLSANVANRSVYIIDDMVDTAGTLVEAAKAVTKAGALSVGAIATHGIFTDPATERITASDLSEVIVSDTLQTAGVGFGLDIRFDVFSVAPVIARFIRASING